jgi:5-(carboxyamino)imidazole ribonucleotide synthase
VSGASAPGAAGDAIAPGARIGILGGGQLGRMTALAAARLGYRTVVLCPEPDGPASQVTDTAITASYDDPDALAQFADSADVVTLEFENLPAAALEALAARVPVRPGAGVLRVSQDRLLEKRFALDNDVATADFAPVDGVADLEAAFGRLGGPLIVKTRRFGYDGKGQVRVEGAEAAAAIEALAGAPAIAERVVDFEREISVLVARGVDGTTATYDPVENRHENHILRTTVAPADIPAALADEAREIGRRLATALDLVGLLAIELFVARDGRLLFNEMAPRPHNSGHWTIDACAVSQFEMLVRAVCGLPLGSPERHSDAEMTNLLGDEAADWPRLLAEPNACLHLYGKAEARPGRKMGHVTRLRPKGATGRG